MIHLITDSMSDITQAEAQELNLVVIPLQVLFGEESFLDGVDIHPAEFYARLRGVKQLPKTSQATPESFCKAFETALELGGDVVCITGSSKLSGTYQSAVIARDMQKEPQRIHLIDSLNASLSEALLVQHAVKLRNMGMGVQELVSELQELVGRIRLVGQVDDLKHLVMGGRLNATTARVGSALKLKPLLRLVKGKLEQDGIIRGKKRVQEWFVKQIREEARDPAFPVFLASSNAPEELMVLKEAMEEQGALGDAVGTVEIGSVIGTHTGPGLLAIAWVCQ